MSYQVLARKWRPKTFGQVIGQQHVLQALINALQHGRLHHAYLFSGTRGVGKTTLARIFAKSLNCERNGVTADPCGECGPCQEIDQGRFVDLIEVDAASKTKVEDTRELLENVQYRPSRGRFKVYLIDEVHMLSNHSFNALLKTLEEPPEHVKFLLATTDPQKLPVTVLSRCLQFHLMNMSAEQIVGYLGDLLVQEKVEFEQEALWQIGRAANGSMRDALSLTDQAIAYSNNSLSSQQVAAMLGTLDNNQVVTMLDCLVRRDPAHLLSHIADWSRFSPDFHQLLTELTSMLHRVAIGQIVPDAVDNSLGDKEVILELGKRSSPEDIQLFYQLGILARKDLPLAPDARSGFEMALMRMMVFSPAEPSGPLPPLPGASDASYDKASSADMSAPGASASQELSALGIQVENVVPEINQPEQQPDSTNSSEPDPSSGDPGSLASPEVFTGRNGGETPMKPTFSETPPWETGYEAGSELSAQHSVSQVEPEQQNQTNDQISTNAKHQTQARVVEVNSDPPVQSELGHNRNVDHFDWLNLFWTLNFDDITESIFGNASASVNQQSAKPEVLDVIVKSDYSTLYSQSHADILLERLQAHYPNISSVQIEFGDPPGETPYMYRARCREQRRLEAISTLQQDAVYRQLQTHYDARLDEASVKPRIH